MRSLKRDEPWWRDFNCPRCWLRVSTVPDEILNHCDLCENTQIVHAVPFTELINGILP